MNKQEFKTREDLEEEATHIARLVFKCLRLDVSDVRTERLFNANTKAMLSAYLLDVYKDGYHQSIIDNSRSNDI